MKKLQMIGLNDYTDEKGWELVIRKIDTLVWGFYRDDSNGCTISDSQFNIFNSNNDLEDLEDRLKEELGLRHLGREFANQY